MNHDKLSIYINKWFIDADKWFINIDTSFINIDKSFMDIDKWSYTIDLYQVLSISVVMPLQFSYNRNHASESNGVYEMLYQKGFILLPVLPALPSPSKSVRSNCWPRPSWPYSLFSCLIRLARSDIVNLNIFSQPLFRSNKGGSVSRKHYRYRQFT